MGAPAPWAPSGPERDKARHRLPGPCGLTDGRPHACWCSGDRCVGPVGDGDGGGASSGGGRAIAPPSVRWLAGLSARCSELRSALWTKGGQPSGVHAGQSRITDTGCWGAGTAGGVTMGCPEGGLLSQQKWVISGALYERMSCEGLGGEWENPGLDGHLDPHRTAAGAGGMESTAKDPVTPASWYPELTSKGQRGPCSWDYVEVWRREGPGFSVEPNLTTRVLTRRRQRVNVRGDVRMEHRSDGQADRRTGGQAERGGALDMLLAVRMEDAA